MRRGIKFFMLVGAVTILSYSGFSAQSYAAGGKALYQAKCAMCHHSGAASNLIGKNGKEIMTAINEIPMMKMLKGKITKNEANDVGKYLQSLKK